LEIALSIIETPDSPHLVIVGNPGIGKTYFGNVLLLHLARHGSTVVYESEKAKCRYLFPAD
jgi:KaiC/GvpD/RAD55 family RecA-like ATPase